MVLSKKKSIILISYTAAFFFVAVIALFCAEAAPYCDNPDGNIPVMSESFEGDDVHILREFNGVIGVFSGDGELEQTVRVYVLTLPYADREMLAAGIVVYSEQELNGLIEDYSG